MSSHDGSEDEEELEDEGEGDCSAAELAPEDEGKVQQKLHLFQCASVQQSIRRLWDMLPQDEQGELVMEGYIELNLRMQKCLSAEFVLEWAVDSAIGDWSEDVREEQQSMTADEFAMFLFELCSLWCGPSVSLRVYLLFLNATFIAISEARGAHTVGLKPLDAVEHLPKAFFDLLHLQGWAKDPEDERELNEEQAFGAWYARNLDPENELAALLQIQRQVFQVTHDVRAVFLFKNQDGRRQDEPDVLQLVKLATNQLHKVSKADVHGLPPALPAAARTSPRTELVAQPWCPPTHARAPGGPQSGAAAAAAARASAIVSQKRWEADEAGPRAAQRGRSVPGRPTPQRSVALSAAASQQVVPIGRVFDTRRSSETRARGLALAGQATISTSSVSKSLMPIAGGTPMSQGSATSLAQRAGRTDNAGSRAGSAVPPRTPSRAGTPELFSHTSSPMAKPASVPGAFEPEQIEGNVGAATWLQEEEHAQMSNFLESAQLLPPYKLPKNPAGLYRKQAEVLMKMSPSSVVFETNKWQASHKLLSEPFDRVLRKLPEDVRSMVDGPIPGPMAHPNEPVWFEMSHRLQAILKKQGKRAERRKKRKQRSKLMRGRSKPPPQRSDGRDLREYLDRAAAERTLGKPDVPGVPAGEFLGKVHETFMQHRERMEMEVDRFQIRGAGGAVVKSYSWGDTPPRAARVVRPVYIPPPGAEVQIS